MAGLILIIDDDRDLCKVLSTFLKKKEYEVEVAQTGEDGLKILREHEFDLVLCDFRLPDMTGVETLRKIKVINPKVAVVIITGYSDVRTAVETFKYGANDYVTKPLYPDELLVTIKETIQKNKERSGQSEKSAEHVSKPIQTTDKFIKGPSPQSATVQRHIELIAPSDMSVIIEGETGTGKEFVALSIHKLSSRVDKPFIAIDCGALPKELAGSELFGHVKGSFTGAVNDKPGSFEIANGGTIFLDEIGNLSYENQIKLLRVIQERKIKRIGANKDTSIDVRILVATNEDLGKALKEGRFREDLYHRLNEFKISLLPLRDRQDDILTFANHFLKNANSSLNREVEGFSAEVINYFMKYEWYGNLRELNNVVKRSVLLTTGKTIEGDSLPHEITRPGSATENSYVNDENILKSVAGNAERQAILDALEKVNNNKSKAAAVLNIDRKTLYNKLKLYKIQE
ncbi:MAG: sigma-54-dependent Fis family transcriptional regulator [Cyclobacteriaceae bacterium]|nr:sigma-54-dependent Fis family transcriptional regulator [Cyclobacteriaceae bacterium]